MHRWIIKLGLGLAIFAGMVFSPSLVYALPPHQSETTLVEITSPQPNAVVSGVVQIVGTVIAPDFALYRLDYAPDPPISEESWAPMQVPINQQVRDGVLGAWDTTTIADGRYFIRLQVTLNDGTILEAQVRVNVVNATWTPPPTPLPTFTHTPLPGTATPGPSPTSLIHQPPTRTPRPTSTPGGPTVTPTSFSLAESPFSPQRLRQAACTGGFITLGGFGVFALYLIMRGLARNELRVMWWNIQRRVLEPITSFFNRNR